MNKNNMGLLVFISLLLCNSADAMQRMGYTEFKQMLEKQSIDGTIVKATSDHHCKHCDKWITTETPAYHAMRSHQKNYSAVSPAEKKQHQVKVSFS